MRTTRATFSAKFGNAETLCAISPFGVALVNAITIRSARPEEAEFLTRLAMESKATWGYSAEFMERCAPLLRVTSDYISAYPVFVAELNDKVAGFYSLNPSRYTIELDLLFVKAGALRRGIGGALLRHAFDTAFELGFSELYVESDPGAELFYARGGGVRIGSIASTIEENRALPVLRFDLSLMIGESATTS